MAYSRATRIAKLETRRDAILDELAAMSSSTAGGLPNTSGLGVNIDHQGYKRGLLDELAWIEERLNAEQMGATGIVETEGY